MRIAIVNDSMMAVEAMRRSVSAAPGHQVAWIAYNGNDAITLCKRDKPDLILMDLIMPGLDGAQTTRQIMAQSPCPILIVTASVRENSSKVFEALGAGASALRGVASSRRQPRLTAQLVDDALARGAASTKT